MGRRGIPIKIVETGEEFQDMTACAKAIKGQWVPIRDVLNGKLPSYKGFTFERLNYRPETPKVEPPPMNLTLNYLTPEGLLVKAGPARFDVDWYPIWLLRIVKAEPRTIFFFTITTTDLWGGDLDGALVTDQGVS
jgi:hypothetical protein